MNFHQWRSRLVNELRKRNVPPSYARRLLAELEDHFFDLQEVEMSYGMEANSTIDLSERLGDPQHLAQQAAEAKVYPTWAGRHPWLALAAGTPAIFVLSIVAVSLLIIGMATFFEGSTVETTPGLTQACVCASWAITFIPAVITSLLLCRMFAFSGRRRLWALAACSMIAFLAGCLAVSCIPPHSQPGTGRLTIGFFFGSGWQISQAIAPLLIGIIFMAMGKLASDKIKDDFHSQQMRSTV